MTAKCDVCGNVYDKAFRLIDAAGTEHTFDCFECAIHMVAPTCGTCGVRVIGHGLEPEGQVFCCAHCARKAGKGDGSDRS